MDAISAGGRDSSTGDTIEALAHSNGGPLGTERGHSNEARTALVLKKTTRKDGAIAATKRKPWDKPPPPSKLTPLRPRPEPAYTGSGSASSQPTESMLDFKQEISDDITGIQKKIADLGRLVDSYRGQCDDKFSDLFDKISSLRTDVESLTVSLNKERRHKESENQRIKKLEENLEASKQSWNDLAANLKEVVSRAQLSLQNRRKELERSMSEFPGKQEAIQDDLASIRRAVEHLQDRFRSMDGRVTICETEGEINARAWEATSANLDAVHQELPNLRRALPHSHEPRDDDAGEVGQRHVGESTSTPLGAGDKESTPLPLAPLSDSFAMHGSRSPTPPAGSDSSSSMGSSLRSEEVSSGISSDWVEASEADSHADAETMPSDSEAPQLQFVDPSTIVPIDEECSPPVLGQTNGVGFPVGAVRDSDAPERAGNAGVLPENPSTKYALLCILGGYEAKAAGFLREHWATSTAVWRAAPRFITFNTRVALAWLVAFLAALLLLWDPFQTRIADERPAYRAFRRRQGLLPPSLPDALEWVIVAYLTLFMYFL